MILKRTMRLAQWVSLAALLSPGNIAVTILSSYQGGASTATSRSGIRPKSVKVRRSVEPVDLRQDPQLFIDDYLIAESGELRKVVQQPKRFLDRPILGWEHHTTQPYATVLRDAQSGLFRMWYTNATAATKQRSPMPSRRTASTGHCRS